MYKMQGVNSGDIVGGGTPFNMAGLLMAHIMNRQNDADLCLIQGNLIGYYRCVQVLYLYAHFKIEENKEKHTEDENKILEKLKKAKGIISTQSNSQHLNLTIAEEDLFEVRKLVNKILYEEGLLYPKKITKTFEDEIAEDFQ